MTDGEIMHEREQQLLLYMAKNNLSQSEVQKVRRLLTEVQCDYVLSQAFINGIGNLFLNNLIEYGLDNKYPFLEYFADLYTASCLRRDIHVKAAKELTQAFAAYKLDYVLIKGLNLQNKLYSAFRFHVRDFSDLDVLIRKNDLNKFEHIVSEIGYTEGRIEKKTQILTQVSRTEILEGKMFYHQIPDFLKKAEPYYSYANVIDIDVNFSAFWGGQFKDAITIDEFFQHKYLENYNNEFCYWSLEPMYEIIQNCFHIYKHLCEPQSQNIFDGIKIINLLDIYNLIQKYREQINWDEFLLLLHQRDLDAPFYVVLSIVQQIYKDLNIDFLLDRLNTKKDYGQMQKVLDGEIQKYLFDHF